MEIYIANLSIGIREEDLARNFLYLKNKMKVEIVRADGLERKKDFAIIHIDRSSKKKLSFPELTKIAASVAL